MNQPPPCYNRPVHILAILTACATFPLIFMGGLVTSKGAGMAVYDWPNTMGYNMFLFPPSQWVGGVFYEHTHRLIGSLVGFLAVLLALFAWFGKNSSRVKWMAGAVLAAVTVQGVLGGYRVRLNNLDLAIVHGCIAQAFFCLAALMAAMTSKWWIATPQPEPTKAPTSALVKLAVTAVIVVYLQLIAGAVMRHEQAGLAIPDLPLAYGKLLPPTSETAMPEINAWRAARDLPAVTLGQVWFHFAHRVGAVLVTCVLLALLAKTIRRHRAAACLATLLVAQLALGVFTVLYRKPADVATAHVAVGALVLVTAFLLAAILVRARGGRVAEAGWRAPLGAPAMGGLA